MNQSPRSVVAVLGAVAAAALLVACEKKTTTVDTPMGSTTTTTTTAPTATTPSMSSMGASASAMTDSAASATSGAMGTAANAIGDAAITAKVKTALLADSDVKGLQIEVDTKDGAVLLTGTADNESNSTKAATLARGIEGVKSVEIKIVKTAK